MASGKRPGWGALNYLAHVFLAGPDPERSLGSLVADWQRRGPDVAWSAGMGQGIALHMAVDRYVDHHPAFRRSVRRLDSRHRHLRPAMVDVYCDHFLTRHWERYSAVGLRRFLDDRYAGWLDLSADALPPRLGAGVRRLVVEDWLFSYGQLAGVDAAFGRMRWRLRRPEVLDGATAALGESYGALEGDFLELFPDVQAFSRGWLADDTVS